MEVVVFFFCCSGVCFIVVVIVVIEVGYGDCYNIFEGFEGDKDVNGYCNNIGGWCWVGFFWY